MTCAAAGIADPLGPHYKARGNMASSPSPPLPRPPLRIAIVGGGFAGCCAAAALHAALPPPSAEVVLFDMGGRGAGGRCSHRRVRRADSVVLPDDAPPPSPAEVMEFDHGAQFFRAKSQVMCRLARHWVRRGWAAEWQGRFGRLSAAEGAGAAASQPSPIDFFGCPPPPSEPLYVGVGGMQTICRQVLARDAPGVAVHRGARVSQVEWVAADGGKGGRWRLYGTVGRAALHDTPEAEAADVASPSRLDGGTFDLLLMTDVSSSCMVVFLISFTAKAAVDTSVQHSSVSSPSTTPPGNEGLELLRAANQSTSESFTVNASKGGWRGTARSAATASLGRRNATRAAKSGTRGRLPTRCAM